MYAICICPRFVWESRSAEPEALTESKATDPIHRPDSPYSPGGPDRSAESRIAKYHLATHRPLWNPMVWTLRVLSSSSSLSILRMASIVHIISQSLLDVGPIRLWQIINVILYMIWIGPAEQMTKIFWINYTKVQKESIHFQFYCHRCGNNMHIFRSLFLL